MKNYFKISAALFMFAGFVSCTNEEIIEQNQTDNFSVEAIMNLAESRTNPEAYVENGETKYHTNWHAEDAIYVFGKRVKGTLTLQDGAGTTNGKFSGRIYGDSRNLKFSAYPAELAEVGSDGSVTGFNLTEIDFKNTMAPMFGTFSNPRTVNFQHLAGMVRVKIDNVPANSTFELKGRGISGKANLVDNGDGIYSLEPEIKNDITSIKVTNIPAGNQTIYIPIFIANPDANGIQERYLSLNLNGKKLVGDAPKVKTMVGNVTTKNMPELVWNEANESLTRVSTLDENTQPEEVEENTDATKDYDYLITSAEQLLWFANEVNAGNDNFEGKVVKLGASIDLNGQKWNPIDGGDKMFKGTFDGANFLISNLKVETVGTASAGLFAQAQGTVKNLYFENVDIKGHYKAGAVVGNGLCSKIENCHVNGGTITVTPYEKDDANNVGGIVGYLSAEPAAWVKDCSVNGLNVTAYRKVGGIVGAANGDGGTPEVSNNTVTNTAIIADQTSEYKSIEAPNAGKVVGWNGKNIDLSSNNATNVTVEIKINDADDMIAALENGEDVTFQSDIKINPAGMSNAYGTTGINVKNGQTIDGKGFTLDVKGAGGTWDSGINTTGGLIKNLTVTGSFRGIFISHNSTHSEKVILENVIIDGTTYTISCDQGKNQGLEATNSTFKGWTSYAGTLGDAKFTNCYFGEGNGYSYCRPYAPTEFIGCEFEEGYTLNPRAKVEFINCSLNGVALTDSNISELISGDLSLVTVK
ncbi:MAG: hypothetical protein IJB96_11865 [Lachnospira sp.]|nr:hypothetical protein [Bacteroides sp.]MBQ4284607.1 hypothetical protein [Lachnospira sp.]